MVPQEKKGAVDEKVCNRPVEFHREVGDLLVNDARKDRSYMAWGTCGVCRACRLCVVFHAYMA